ncbi:hypothetical protein ANCDUO_09567 [Ancylostoma duodenale]|uniref:Uncharacterized protein n=1 Tax=Ancylostoma duodenale TaxID=51022 RepID=A0A0C2DCM1_9BILA|nr:hypothetical protein ANCDUO_09567 [Ancylostoma duodenale]
MRNRTGKVIGFYHEFKVTVKQQSSAFERAIFVNKRHSTHGWTVVKESIRDVIVLYTVDYHFYRM